MYKVDIEKIEARRKELGWSCRQLGREVLYNTRPHTYAEIVSRNGVCSPSNAIKLIAWYGSKEILKEAPGHIEKKLKAVL